MADKIKQLKTEIKNQVLLALDSVLRERWPGESYRVEKAGKKRFLDAIVIKRTECVHHTEFNDFRLDERNEFGRDYQFPGHPSR